MKTLCLILTLVAAQYSHADELQDLKDQKIISFFRTTATQIIDDLGKAFNGIDYDNKRISFSELKTVLSNATIEVQYKDLIDNTGSIVDAIGVPGKVTLDGRRWIELTKGLRSSHLLVLHEVLRMARINDNDFRYSLNYLPSLQSDKTIAPYCNLRVQTTSVKVLSKIFSGEGFSTPITGGFFSTELMRGRSLEAQDNAIKDMEEKCNNKGFEKPSNISGGLTIMNTSGLFSSKSVYKATLQGTCYKNEVVKRDSEDQKKEICQKISLCENIFREGQTSNSDDVNLMDQLNKKWRCL